MTSDEVAGQELCKNCGLCCEGLLHSHGILKPEEVERAEALGLDLLDGSDSSFALPCPKFERCCTIYEERPRACRGFRCALLKQLDDRSVGLEDALQIVSEARRLAKEALPGVTVAALASRFRHHLRMRENCPVGDEDAAERLGFIALALFLDRHFVLPRDGHFFAFRPIAGTTE